MSFKEAPKSVKTPSIAPLRPILLQRKQYITRESQEAADLINLHRPTTRTGAKSFQTDACGTIKWGNQTGPPQMHHGEAPRDPDL